MKRFGVTLLIISLIALVGKAQAAEWQPDSLGDGFLCRYVDQGTDYSGKVRSTIVKKTAKGSSTAILYVHGFNDYFFQTEMANFFVNNGISFYAVDLRKYGRSLMPGQKRFEVRDLKEYFADIDSTLSAINGDGINNVVMMGHSTGGLITSYYLSCQEPREVKGLILNSPFLDWNLSGFNENVAVPAMNLIGRLRPGMKIPQGDSQAYFESLDADHHGRWHFDQSKKLAVSPAVTSGWIKAIDEAQHKLQRGNVIHIPILLMHSDNSVEGDEWSEAFNHGDAVLDVRDIVKYGRRLGPSVTDVTVKGGLHDLVLSSPEVERAVLERMLRFVEDLGLASREVR